MPILTTLGGLLDISKKLEIFEPLRKKLFNNPDTASEMLAATLDELSKVYISFDSELTNYLSLNFDDKNIPAGRKQLLMMEGIQLEDRLNRARGHCHTIGEIYYRHLRGWFSRVLNANEQRELHELFDRMSTSDAGMINSISELSSWMEEHATTTLDLVDEGKIGEANKSVIAARKEASALVKELRRSITEMSSLSKEFRQVTV
jgi:hypothetical protein